MRLSPASPDPEAARLLHAPQAWVDGRWQADVLLEIAPDGTWSSVTPGRARPPAGARALEDPVLPGLVNAHSHAFQRAFAGQGERREGAHDDFWSWRDRMYGVALRITPEEMHATATALYRELLAGGYTHVCEFHYLHHAPDGRPYPQPWTMARALAQAAQDSGIGLTLLPVLYERAGFTQPALRPDQRRFATTVDEVIALRDAVRAWKLPRVEAGVAIHSLRAARPESIAELARRCADDPGPIHIHVAEQTGEVQACLAATGQRPIEWLCEHVPLDTRWQLVHATHATPAEIEAVARTGAGVVVCPTTEANLGDGLFDLPRWLESGTPLSIGSDSHVSRQWPRELQLLEYGQRLLLRRRSVAAAPERGEPSTAQRLFQDVLRGGAAAAAQARHGLVAGARADCVVLDTTVDALAGVPTESLLDVLVFATDRPALAEVWVAGRRT
jgi:formimidoylglutamate deiminase